MDELLEQFILEGRELVQRAFENLLALERGGPDPARVDGAFRAIHTLKGSAGLFDVAPMGTALHAAEDLMSALRAGRRGARPHEIEALLDCMGAVESWVEAIAVAERLPDDAEARSRLLVEALRDADGDAAPAPEPAPAPDWLAGLLDAGPAHPQAATAFRYSPSAGCFFLGDDPLTLVRGVPSLLKVEFALREAAAVADYDPFRCTLVISALSAAPVELVREACRLAADQVTIVAIPPRAALPAAPVSDQAGSDRAGSNGAGSDGAGSDPARGAVPEAIGRTLRVEAGQIDALADLVGELFVAKNRLSHLAAEAAAAAPNLARSLAAGCAEIDGLVGSMHRSVASLRLVPLEQSLRRLPRLVREIAARLGREVQFAMTGAQTRADKAIADGLFEPLLHVLRNAVDHGVEPPAARAASGKPAAGRITLRAGHEDDQVVVTVQDDGAGIDPAALRRIAVARGMLDRAAADALDDASALDLVFQPGFSTAAAVTEVSGRGVGMDAVRAALRAMGGDVGLVSAAGAGTTVRMAVPQAMAVATVVIVQAGSERFGVPIEAIAEITRVKRAGIVAIRAGHAVVLRERTIPLLRLADLLGQQRGDREPPAEIHLMVIMMGEERIGIEVDRFGARVEVAVRPLRGLLAGLPGVRGSALLGDGGVLLVLDMTMLVG